MGYLEMRSEWMTAFECAYMMNDFLFDYLLSRSLNL